MAFGKGNLQNVPPRTLLLRLIVCSGKVYSNLFAAFEGLTETKEMEAHVKMMHARRARKTAKLSLKLFFKLCVATIKLITLV